MKILFLIWNYWPCVEGGSERQARQVANELAQRGHTCIIWTALLDSSMPRKESKADTSIFRFGRWVPWQNRARRVLDSIHQFIQVNLRKWFPDTDKYYIKLKSHLDFWVLLPVVYITRCSFMKEIRTAFKDTQLPFDIIHLHEPSWLGGFAVQLAKAKKVPVLCQEATNPALPVLGYDVPERKRIEQFRRDAHFIAMAPYLEADLSANGVATTHIHILPNGVKIPAVDDARKEMPIVLYVGNFSQGAHWKAFDILFEAWKRVDAQQLGLRLVVLGGGDRSLWEKYVDTLGCSGTVDFKGRVNAPEDYYQKAAIFVLPSRVEGMSNALLEAQSWGIPCVVSHIPGNTSIVEDGVNGVVVPVNDSQALAEAVVMLYKNKPLREKIGNAGRHLMEEKYEVSGVIDRLVGIYENIIKVESVGMT